MNGVRRFLGGVASSNSTAQQPQPPPTPPPLQPTAPLVISGKKPSWPPPSPTEDQQDAESPVGSPKTTTVGLFLRKDKQKPAPPSPQGNGDETFDSSLQSTRPILNTSVVSARRSQSSLRQSSPVKPPNGTQSLPSSPGAGPSSSSPLRPAMPTRKSLLIRKTIHQIDSSAHDSSQSFNTRDELLISLLASQAVVDSRDYPILSAEDVEELKKEQQVLGARLIALNKKLSLEMKIRDAAISLSKVNASHKKVSKQTQEQLETANNRVDAAQKELWRVSERANDVGRKLLEHRAGVLGMSVRSMEKKTAPPGLNGEVDGPGFDTPNLMSQLSPTLSTQTSASTSSKGRFEGAHLFAGHADAIVPTLPRPTPSHADVFALEEKLKVATDKLNAANRKQVEMRQELSLLQLEKAELETTMGMELQNAEETIVSLEKELTKLDECDIQMQTLQEEKRQWEQDKSRLAERERQVEVLERRLEVLEERSGEATEMETLLLRAREELEEKRKEVENLRGQQDTERSHHSDELQHALDEAHAELDDCRDALHALVQAHGMDTSSGESSLIGLASSIDVHLEGLASQFEEQIAQVRRERDEAAKEARVLESRLKEQSKRMSEIASQRLPASPTVQYSGDAASLIASLQPIWSMLPSPEARASKLGARTFRTGSPSSPSSPRVPAGGSSISDMDVRSLKTLYDNRVGAPNSPNPAAFSVEAFASRVQALIQDDRALIERLIRFAQAHDLLKKNAERAQKLAQDSNSALETYQKQVKVFEERNMTMVARNTALQNEVKQLQDTIDRISAEKLELETHAAQQAEALDQLTDANNTLSARTLSLAEEAASSSDSLRRQMEGQLSECRASLQRAEQEIDAMRTSEQSQRAVLLDELNSVQTENGNLRAQLRAAAAKK
ncbi:hypothetical protein JAAARDRAFT_28088 [Jaapia argillacea MUCL 33604]|uniref:Up-regulated during septation protein 1 domain-containing protein n=1 Tax=Jaapia argillacea MUCL 33604 TaxID=933084 RepID=A0A067QLT7_9AGAM|nr:hypothetical protein JAAARDRAFT_28088 [Jaapia argillacea MUCL 33604]